MHQTTCTGCASCETVLPLWGFISVGFVYELRVRGRAAGEQRCAIYSNCGGATNHGLSRLGARVVASCYAARFAAADAVDSIATAAAFDRISRGNGICMPGHYVQRFSLSRPQVSVLVRGQSYFRRATVRPQATNSAFTSALLLACVLLRQWTGCSELMDVHSRMVATLECGRLLHQRPTGRRWPRWPLDHLLRDRPVFRRLKVCGWRASNSPGIQC